MSLLILAVDDDRRILSLLERVLQRAGFAVKTATNGQEVRRIVQITPPDLVLLDLMLAQEDGMNLARELRKTFEDLPIIFVSGKTDTLDKVLGLEIGADDYVTKPFDERELLARIRSVLRRVNLDTPNDYRKAKFGDWELDLRNHRLYRISGEPLHLTNHEVQLLKLLLQHRGQVLSRDAILNAISQEAHDPLDRRVDVLVGKLRKKIEADPHNPAFIKTIRSMGYRFTELVSFE